MSDPQIGSGLFGMGGLVHCHTHKISFFSRCPQCAEHQRVVDALARIEVELAKIKDKLEQA